MSAGRAEVKAICRRNQYLLSRTDDESGPRVATEFSPFRLQSAGRPAMAKVSGSSPLSPTLWTLFNLAADSRGGLSAASHPFWAPVRHRHRRQRNLVGRKLSYSPIEIICRLTNDQPPSRADRRGDTSGIAGRCCHSRSVRAPGVRHPRECRPSSGRAAALRRYEAKARPDR